MPIVTYGLKDNKMDTMKSYRYFYIVAILLSSCAPVMHSDSKLDNLDTWQDGFSWAYDNQIDDKDECDYLNSAARDGCIDYVDD